MKTVYWDQNFYFDDPNIRWGNPAYQLEPGDPGYVPYFPPKHDKSNHKKTKTMKHNSYYPVRVADQITWLSNFSGKLPGLSSPLGLNSGQVSAAVADCLWLIYTLQLWLPAVRKWALGATAAATEAQSGTGTSVQVLPVFTPPPLPNGTVAVLPGALDRLFMLIQTIKDGGKCSDANATNLGILGSEQTPPDYALVQPVLAASIVNGQILIKWGWGGNGAYLDMCEIQVDRGDGKGFGLLVYDTTPNYTDTQTFPTALTKWTYRAIYHLGDKAVGLWSNPVSVTVPA